MGNGVILAKVGLIEFQLDCFVAALLAMTSGNQKRGASPPSTIGVSAEQPGASGIPEGWQAFARSAQTLKILPRTLNDIAAQLRFNCNGCTPPSPFRHQDASSSRSPRSMCTW
jgi:hypothetical protein